MIPIEILRGTYAAASSAILARARDVEGRRVERTLTDADVMVFLSCVDRYPMSRIRTYAQRGNFVSKKRGPAALITVIEYTPADRDGPAQMSVSTVSAQRPHGRGPYVERDGQREV